MAMALIGVPPAPPEPLRKEWHDRGGVDGDHPDARLAEAPPVDVDDRGRTGEGLHCADDGRGDHEQAREEEQRDADLARPRDSQAEEERGGDAHDDNVSDDVEDDERPKVLRAKRAFRAGEGLDLPIIVISAVSRRQHGHALARARARMCVYVSLEKDCVRNARTVDSLV